MHIPLGDLAQYCTLNNLFYKILQDFGKFKWPQDRNQLYKYANLAKKETIALAGAEELGLGVPL